MLFKKHVSGKLMCAYLISALVLMMSTTVYSENTRRALSETVPSLVGSVRGLPTGTVAQVIASSAGYLLTANTNNSGEFKFVDLPDGEYSIKAVMQGYNTGAAQSIKIVNSSQNAPTIYFDALPLPTDKFTFEWKEDVSVAGSEYSAYVNKPHTVQFLDQIIEIPDLAAAEKLLHDYNILLSNERQTWSQEHAYRLLETLSSIPQNVRNPYNAQTSKPTKWILENDYLADDISVTPGEGITVKISSAAFIYATPKVVQIDGKKGNYYSQRLHHAVLRYVTNNGENLDAVEYILTNRYGISTRVPDYSALTAGITNETEARFQRFHPLELIHIINMYEEMPTGFHKINGLKYLLRRLDGTFHPRYPQAPAVAWPSSTGYIEFMESAFLCNDQYLHRLILHEKTHFLWAQLFSDGLKSKWIELGGWYENPDDPDGWSTTKTTEFVSAYAHGENPNEDMAESVADFTVNPDILRSRSLPKYEFIRDYIMQGDIYISKIREDLTFEVYNLFPDYVYPGKIKRVSISVEGKPEEDKKIIAEIELHTLDKFLEGASYANTRIFSEAGTYIDMWFYPVDTQGNSTSLGSILRGQVTTLSKYAKSGFWIADQITLTDTVGNQRFEGVDDFGWKMYINNPLEDLIKPKYVAHTMNLNLKTDAQSYERPVQVLTASWQVEENKSMRSYSPCYASLVNHESGAYRHEAYGQFDAASGKCNVQFIATEYFASGLYEVNQICMYDAAENSTLTYFTGQQGDESPQSIQIVTSNPDMTPPELDLNKITISAVPTRPEAPNGETIVDIVYYARDDKSGLGTVRYSLRDPQGLEHGEWYYHENTWTVFFQGDPAAWKRYAIRTILPEGSAPGIWGLSMMALYDKALNAKTYDFTEIIHVNFEVLRTSQSIDNGAALIVTVSGTGSGTITSLPSGINCGSNCIGIYNNVTPVTLIATQATGSTFTSWSGDCSGIASCSVTMDASKNVTATFNDITAPTGSIVINSGVSYIANASINLTLSCTDNMGCTKMRFSNDSTNWSTAEDYSPTKSWNLLSPDETKTVYVKFKDAAGNWSQAYSDTIILDTTMPVATPSSSGGTYTGNQTITLTANEGATIYYTLDGSIPSTLSPIYSSPISISATTTLKYLAVDAAGNAGEVKTETYALKFPLTVNKIGTGTGTVTSLPSGMNCGDSCSVAFDYGSAITLTATPSSGSYFKGWSGGICTGTGTCTVTTDAVKNATAIFGFLTDTGTNVSGLISSNTAWKLENSPYIVTSSILVNSGVTLTIEPGVTVKFNSGKSLQVNGALNARGTGNAPITFTSNQATPAIGDWGNITFNDSSIDATYDENGKYTGGSILEHCVAELGGKGSGVKGVIQINYSAPFINYTIIRNNSASGIYISGFGQTATSKITNNLITNNSANDLENFNGGGIHVYENNAYIANNIIANNSAINYGGGIYINQSWVTVRNNVISQNIASSGGGIYSYCGGAIVTISNNSINNNTATQGSGINIDAATITNNTMSGNKSSNSTIYFFTQYTPSLLFNNNSIFKNATTYEILNNSSVNWNAKNNYWGTINESQIQDIIFDWFEDNAKGLVDFSSFLLSPNVAAPISPPTGLTVTKGTGSITLKWNANPEGDVAGYKVYWSTKSGYPYEHFVDVGNVTTYTITGITKGIAAVVTAYDTGYSAVKDNPTTVVNENQVNGNESWCSEEFIDTSAGTIIKQRSGVYASPVNVTLTTYETATIYYTTDGTTPTTDSPVYSSPIPINQTTILKLFALDALGNQEPVRTEKYTIITNGFIALEAGSNHSLALKADGTIWTWGWNNENQLGDGTGTSRNIPTRIGTDTNWAAAVAAGGSHSLALKSDGTLWAWGRNLENQLGDGTTTAYRLSPIQIGADTNWSAVAAGNSHSLALKSDGTLWAWGRNADGQLGDGTANNKNIPTKIGVDSNWVSIAAGGSHSLALKSDGTIWSWGDNWSGQLGYTTTNNKQYIPTKIGADTAWIAISAGSYHSLALKSDGTLWAWGENGYGQVGDVTNINRYFPVLVGIDTAWIAISAGSYHSLALKSDGSLWAWGSNGSSQLGDGTTVAKYTPTQIGNDTNWAAITGGDSHTFALKSNGTLWSWGDNGYGQLGDGTTENRLVPTQIGGPIYASTLSVSPSPKDFGSVEVGQSSSPAVLTISNTGNVNLVITSIGIAGTDSSMFSMATGTCPTLAPTLAAAASCTVTVIFSPASTGTKQATLKIASNDPNKPTSNMVLAGTGYANDFSITSGDISVVKGESKDIAITLTAYNYFNSSVTLSYAFAGSQPVGITPSLSPYNVTPATGGTQVTLTISTTAATAPGSYTLRVTGYSGGVTKTKDISVNIASELSLPVVSIAEGVKGTSYSAAINISGGVAPYTVSLLSGVLPAGLSLSSTGTLSGNPTTRGTYTFTVQVQDAQGHITTKEFSLRIYDTTFRQLVLETTSWTVQKNSTSQVITAKVIDDYGNLGNATSDTSIGISSTSTTGQFTVNEGMTYSPMNTATLTIPVGFSSATFQYKDSTAGTYTLTISGKVATPSAAWESSSHSITVTAPNLKNATLSTSAQNATYGQGITVTGILKDALTNVPLNGKTIRIVFTSPYGSKTSEYSATTGSDGAYTYTTSPSIIDKAGPWGIQATFTDNSPQEYNDTAASATCTIGKADTRISQLVLSADSLSPDSSLTVSGQLSSYANVPLSNIDITIDFTEPGLNGATHTVTAKTTDNAGHFSYTYTNHFPATGPWTIYARLSGTNDFNASTSPEKDFTVATTTGYAILIQGDSNGQYRDNYAATLDDIYLRLINKRNFKSSDIYYLGYNGANHAPNVSISDYTSKAKIGSAITQWAKDKLNGAFGPLYIIMIDHGSKGVFHIGDESLTPAELNTWLTTLENIVSAKYGKPLPTIIVNGSCYSGSFIPTLSKKDAKGARVVITSSTDDELSVQGPTVAGKPYGEYFIYYLFNNLTKGTNLRDAFKDAAKATHQYRDCTGSSCKTNSLYGDYSRQHPLMDDNGDGKGSWMNIVGQEDGEATSSMVLGIGTNPSALAWKEVMGSTTVSINTALAAYAKTTNYNNTAASWIEVRKPSFVDTGSEGTGQIIMNLPVIIGQPDQADERFAYSLAANPSQGFPGLNETGAYTLYYYAMDSDGDIIPPAIGTVYVDAPNNNPPQSFTTISPSSDKDVDDGMMVFRWNKTTDPDGDPITYTIKIYNDNNGAKGSEIKRYELIPQEAYAINAVKEKQNDGATTLFTTGNFYWWEVEAVDSKGKGTIAPAVRFKTTFTNAVGGIVTGIIYSNIDASLITGASISLANTTQTLSLSNGVFMVSLPGASLSSGALSYVISANGYQNMAGSITLSAGEIKTLNAQLSPFDNTDPVTAASPAGGTYNAAQTVVLTCTDTGGTGCAATYYSLDGSTPSTPYTNPISISTTATLKFFSRDVAGNSEAVKVEMYSINIVTPPVNDSKTIQLAAGWNFISISTQPDEKAIEKVLQDISQNVRVVWGYDNEHKVWLKYAPNSELRTPNSLDKVEAGKGYWIYMNNPAALTVTGKDVSSTVTLFAGWNLVGYGGQDGTMNLPGSYVIIWGWENGTWKAKAADTSLELHVAPLDVLNSGKAYWIKMNTAQPVDWVQ